MVTLRVLITVLAVLAAPLIAAAQPASKVARIGILEPGHPAVRAHLVEGFRQSLRQLGYEEGRNLVLFPRFAEGKLDRLPELAAELVRLKVDAIVVATTPGIQAAQQATRTIPIIMTAVGDPVATGFVASLRKPGGNITGRTIQAPELSAKRLQLLKEAVPAVSRVALLWDSANSHEVHGYKETEAAARVLGVTILSFEVRRPEEFEAAFAAMRHGQADGIFVFENAITTNFRKRIVDLAMQQRLPGIYGLREYAEAGGLMSYGPVLIDNYRQAAVYVDKILKGARPEDLPVEQPTMFELVINLKTAKALGLTLPQSLLLRADQVID
jgi:putative tryptophan/tyrosine transport system substrate-binding protein